MNAATAVTTRADLKVRLIREADETVVGDLLCAVYIDGGLTDPSRKARLRELHHLRDAHWFVAESPAGEIIGCVAVLPSTNTAVLVATIGEGEVRLLAVSPRWRGLGIGERLLRACETSATQQGFTAAVEVGKVQAARCDGCVYGSETRRAARVALAGHRL